MIPNPQCRPKRTVHRILTSAAVGLVAAAVVTIFILAAQPAPAAQASKAPPRGAVEGRLTWFDRQGKVVETAGDPGSYRTLCISPDGKHVAVERNDAQTQNRDIWIFEVATKKLTRFTSDPAWDAFPTWSADGKSIIFTSNRGGTFDLYRKPAGGDADEILVYQSSEGKGPTSWSADGRYLLYYSIGQPTHVRLLPVFGPPDRKAEPVVDAQFSSISAKFSPDEHWILYSSNESGSSEISIRPFDSERGSVGSPLLLTRGGGRTPLWRGDGKEIFYLTPDGTVMAMEVNTDGATFQAASPKSLFKVPMGVLFWDVAPDGSRFLMPVSGK